MSNAKDSIPKGTRDFLPRDMILRQEMITKIEQVYERYGFSPMETPAFEYLETLTGKGGEEIKNQIYHFKDKADRDLGLRFDLTVPFTRVVSSYGQELPHPFKRYHISRVWRYEAPQRGRLREFWQADADIAGVATMNAEAELLAMGVEALAELGIRDIQIILNHRKILSALFDSHTIPATLITNVMRALDKLDKVGTKVVVAEMVMAGLSENKAQELLKSLGQKGDFDSLLTYLRQQNLNDTGRQGLAELTQLKELCQAYGIAEKIIIDLSLVRGLDYYTGPIFEIKATIGDYTGSIAGGGRYDQLIRKNTRECVPAVGLSLGLERLTEVLKHSQKTGATVSTVFLVPFSEEFRRETILLAQRLRAHKIKAEISLLEGKVGKRLKYADDLSIPFSVVIGEDELKNRVYPLKKMSSGEVEKISEADMIKRLERFCFKFTQGGQGQPRGAYTQYVSTPSPQSNEV